MTPTAPRIATPTMFLLTMAALWLAAPTPVEAQPAAGGETYLNLSVGAQPISATVDAMATATVYDETAVFSATHTIANGPFVDISAGHHIKWTNLTIGLGFTSFSSKGDAAGTASIPDPVVFDKPTIVNVAASDLQRTERSFNMQAVWFLHVKKKVDVAVSVGPSIIHVSQEFLSGSVAEGTQTVTIVADKQSGTGFGLNVGGDTTYMFSARYGLGFLVRYTWAKVGLPAADVTAGGLQAGVGLRVRF